MYQWAKDNWPGLGLIGAAVGLFVAMSFMSGCSLDDYIPVPLSSDTRAALAAAGADPGPRIALADVPEERAKLVRHIEYQVEGYESLLAGFDEDAGDAAFIRDIAASFLDTGFTTAAGATATLPGGGILTAAIAGLGGLFLSKPGEKAKHQSETKDAVQAAIEAEAAIWREKIESYNEAAKRAKAGEAV